jgi:hypothetical protein
MRHLRRDERVFVIRAEIERRRSYASEIDTREATDSVS